MFFKAWKERRRLEEKAKVTEKFRQMLAADKVSDRYFAATVLARDGDDSGEQLLGAWLRGSRQNEKARNLHDQRDPDPNEAASCLGRLASLGSVKALRQLESAVRLAPPRTNADLLARDSASKALCEIDYVWVPGSAERRGWLLTECKYEDLAREYPGNETIELLAIEASLGYPNAAWGLRYFATALSVEKLAHLVGVTEGDAWNEASKEMFAGRITRDQAEARCSPALSFTARDALYELSNSAWDSRMADVAERVVLSKLNKAKGRNKNVVHDPRYRCRRPGGQAVSYDACEAAWQSYIAKKNLTK